MLYSVYREIFAYFDLHVIIANVGSKWANVYVQRGKLVNGQTWQNCLKMACLSLESSLLEQCPQNQSRA